MQIVSSHGLLENIKNNDILRLPFATILLSKEDKEVVLIFNNNVIYRIHYNVILSETDVMQWFCFISQNKVDVDIELAVVDPAEGPGGPAPLIIEPNWGPRGRKKLFWRPAPPPPPPYPRVWITAPPPYLKVWVRRWLESSNTVRS